MLWRIQFKRIFSSPMFTVVFASQVVYLIDRTPSDHTSTRTLPCRCACLCRRLSTHPIWAICHADCCPHAFLSLWSRRLLQRVHPHTPLPTPRRPAAPSEVRMLPVLQIILHLGLLSRKSGFKIVENANVGASVTRCRPRMPRTRVRR